MHNEGQPPDIRTCIRVTYLENDARIQQLLQPANDSHNNLDDQSAPLEYRYSRNDTDYFSLSPPTPQMLADMPLEKNGTRRRRSSSSSSILAKTLLELSLKDPDTAAHLPAVQGKQSQCDLISQ